MTPDRLDTLGAHLRTRRAAGRKLLAPYVSAGVRDDWVDLVRGFADAGADAIEIGIPFSDPVMDGTTIQEASLRSLARGTTPYAVLAELRGLEVPVPLVAMTYYNLVFRAGVDRFAAELRDAGLVGVILPDLPLEEAGPWRAAAAARGVATVQLAGPVTPDERLRRVCAEAEGFVYGVNLMGVTGERGTLASTSGVLARRLKAATDTPVLMGFGISTPAQAVEAAAPADGVIVASSLMRRVLDGASVADVVADVAALRAALDAS